MSTVTFKNPEVEAKIMDYFQKMSPSPLGIKNIARNTCLSLRQTRAFCLEAESKNKLRRVSPIDVGSNKFSPTLPIVVRRKDRSHSGMIQDINVLTGSVKSKALSRFRRQQLHVFTLA